MSHFHCILIFAILPVRTVLLHPHFVVHISHLRAHLKVVMLDQQWQACASAFLRSCSPSGSEHTVATYRRVLVYFFRNRDPERVTRRDVEDFLFAPANPHRMYGKEPSPATRNTRRAILHSFYKYAASFPVPSREAGPPMPLFRGVAPTAGVRLAKVPHKYRAFNASELARFFAVIPTDSSIGLRDRAIFLFFFYSGRRREEIARLLFGDIEEALFPDGKGGIRPGWRYRYSAKGKAGSSAYAELASPVRAAIWRYLEESGRMDTIVSDDPLFLAIGPEHGGLPIDPYKHISGIGIYMAMKKYCRMAGLDPRLSPHSFRHTSALMRYQVQPDPRAIQRALGHADLRVTTRYLEELAPQGDDALLLLEERFDYL